MAHIDSETINKIRQENDIVDIIGEYIPLTNKGKNYFCVCPFHDDHSPSMSVSSEKQIYSCFSCGATGNVYSFLMNYNNMSFLEAVKFLADKAGISVNVGNTIKKTFTVPSGVTEKDRLLYAQFGPENTGSTIKLKMWIEC